MADVCRSGVHLAECLVDAVDPVRGGFLLSEKRYAGAAAHRLLWQRHMASGTPAYGNAVIESLRVICRSSLVDHRSGGIYRSCTTDASRMPHLEKTLYDNAQFLELLTWVWRVCRCRELRRCAEGIVRWAVAEMRVPGFGFAASVPPPRKVSTAGNGLMLVALVEAGSVFERREWLGLAREVFDEIVVGPDDRDALARGADDGYRGWVAALDDYAMMTRAAIRLFEAFGKQRYLEHAQAWAATLDVAFWDDTNGGYCLRPADPVIRTSRKRSIVDGALPSGNALMIGVHARLHALTGAPRHAERAERLVETFHDDITRSGIAAATAISDAQTAAQLVSIKISGDPRLPETRELMRIALDCGLPDRLVLGPGAGGALGESPRAQICIGTRCRAPIGNAPELRAILSAGALMS